MRVRLTLLSAFLALLLNEHPAHSQAIVDIASIARSAVPASARGVVVDAGGLTKAEQRLVTIEPTTWPAATERRLVLVGGLDGSPDGARAVLDVVHWWYASTSGAFRRTWQLAALPCAMADVCAGTGTAAGGGVLAFPPEKGFFDAPEGREARYVWRWVAMEAPDLVIDVRAGSATTWTANALGAARVKDATPAAPDSFAGALGTGAPSGLAPVAALQITGARRDVVKALQTFLGSLAAGERSPLRVAMDARRSRSTLDIAKLLAAKYPANPIMSYIPALSWIGALKVSALTKDPQYRDRARAHIAPFLTGGKASIAEPYLLTSLAGHQALADLETLDANADAGVAARKAADFILGQSPDEIVRFATKWTDDMFMATSVLARVAAKTGEAKYTDAVTRLLTTYAERLQRPDGVFIHAQNGPHAWGRGNGFAAFGLMEALTHMPARWPGRVPVLDAYRKHMAALVTLQAPDGSWRQVVDEPGTYREFTATAMITTAMARGVRLGWLDASYQRVVDRAWAAVQARVSEAGDLVDVCTGTGAGQNATREYYLTRGAIFGPDDRGGAMALTAALEIHALRSPR